MAGQPAVEEIYAMIRSGDIDQREYYKHSRREQARHLHIGTNGSLVHITAGDKAGAGQSTDFEVSMDFTPEAAREVAEALIESAESVDGEYHDVLVKNT